jgi:PAS domain S-box-containing protein
MILQTGTKVLIAFLIALLLLAGIGTMSYRGTLRVIDDAQRVERSQQAVNEVDRLLRTIAYDAAARREFLIAGDESFLDRQNKSASETAAALDRLTELFKNVPEQRDRLDLLSNLLNERATFSKMQMDMRRAGNLVGVEESVMSGKGEQVLQRILDHAEQMAAAEHHRLSKELRQSTARARETQQVMLIGGVLALVLAGAALALLLREIRHVGQAEEMFRGLLDSAPDAVVIVNRDGRIVRINSETERLFGYERDELLKRPFSSLILEPLPTPDGGSFADYFASPEGRKAGTGLELSARRKDGRLIPVEVSLSPLECKEGLLISSAIRDISRRKQSERALRESEELMRFAMEVDQMGLWEWNTATGAMTRTLRHDQIFGYESLLPKWSYELFRQHVIPEDREEVDAIVADGTATRRGYDFKCRIQRRDDMIRWIRVSGRFLDNEGNIPERIAGIIRDITDEKLAEDSTYQHEQFRAAVLDAIPAEIAVLDDQGRIIAVNEPWLKFGKENSAPNAPTIGVGSNYLSVSKNSALAGEPLAAETAAGIESIIKGELHDFRIEYPCMTQAGMKWFFMHVVAAPKEVGGAIVAHVDITQQKEVEEKLRASEELLRLMTAAIPDTVQVKDAEGRWVVANEATLRHFKIEGTDWVGKTDAEIANLTPPEISKGILQCLDTDLEVWRKGGPIRALERVPQTDGSVRFFDVIKVPLWHPDRKPKLLVVIGRDITQQKEAEEALRNFNTELEARVQERTATLETAMTRLRKEITERSRLEEEILQVGERERMRIGEDLHDDLGQQLVGIAMLANLLATELKAESHPREKEAIRLTTSIAESLNTTRNFAKTFYPVELERGGLIQAIQSLAQRMEMVADFTCILKADPSFHVQKSSEIHLFRIVQESISNAIKHGHAANVEIRAIRENGRCTISVTDDGVGFVQPEDGQWTGMGLHLFQYRARLIGAEITVKRGDPAGCIVTCSMPCENQA